MTYRDRHANLLRSDLQSLDGLSEKPMFGGLSFLLHGHMVCGVHKEGGMFRVGKANEAAALAIPGISPMTLTGRQMGGIVMASGAVLNEDARRRQMIDMALGYVQTLDPK